MQESKKDYTKNKDTEKIQAEENTKRLEYVSRIFCSQSFWKLSSV